MTARMSEEVKQKLAELLSRKDAPVEIEPLYFKRESSGRKYKNQS